MINLKIKASHDVTIRPENMWHTIIECRMDEDDFADVISSLSSEQQGMVLDALDEAVVDDGIIKRKEEKMNTKEVADKYATDKYLQDNAIPTLRQAYDYTAGKEGFEAGAKWQRNHVWHDQEEMPEQGKTLLAQTKHGPYIFGPNNEYWKETSIEMSVIRWAYTDDLLPEGGKV